MVEVELIQPAVCGKCCACKSKSSEVFTMKAENNIQAKLNDLVEIEYGSSEIFKSILIAFLMPVFLLLFGFLIAAKHGETIGIIVGLLFLLIGLMAARLYDRFFNERSDRLAKLLCVVIK